MEFFILDFLVEAAEQRVKIDFCQMRMTAVTNCCLMQDPHWCDIVSVTKWIYFWISTCYMVYTTC